MHRGDAAEMPHECRSGFTPVLMDSATTPRGGVSTGGKSVGLLRYDVFYKHCRFIPVHKLFYGHGHPARDFTRPDEFNSLYLQYLCHGA